MDTKETQNDMVKFLPNREIFFEVSLNRNKRTIMKRAILTKWMIRWKLVLLAFGIIHNSNCDDQENQH